MMKPLLPVPRRQPILTGLRHGSVGMIQTSCIAWLFWGLLVLPAHGAGILLRPVSLRNGIESQISLNWPLADKRAIFSSKYYEEDRRMARVAGIDLEDYLNNQGVAAYNRQTRTFFLLFYNMVESRGCRRNYLIQRVKIRKIQYDRIGRVTGNSTVHLVEAMKTAQDAFKRADRHVKQYRLNGSYKRSVFADLEVGCGTIPGLADSDQWPFGRHRLFTILQDYSPVAGLYNQVEFDFSRNYRFSFHFSRDGSHSVTWPDFVKNTRH